MNLESKQQTPSIHHFTLNFPSKLIYSIFADVRFVFIAGCGERAKRFGAYIAEHVFSGDSSGQATDSSESSLLETLTKQKTRFSLFKIGPVIVANHGMGGASMSIAVHELLVMFKLANVIDKIVVIRFGTCGGLGISPGTLCITTKAMDPLFREYIDIPICGKLVRRPCLIDLKTAKALGDTIEELRQNNFFTSKEDDKVENSSIIYKLGATISTNDFYEEQGRTNGAICEHTEQDKLTYLQQAHNLGVVNIEMEASHLSAMCSKLKVNHGIICVSLNNRLLGDEAFLSTETIEAYERRMFKVLSLFVLKNLGTIKPLD